LLGYRVQLPKQNSRQHDTRRMLLINLGGCCNLDRSEKLLTVTSDTTFLTFAIHTSWIWEKVQGRGST
jgi:hypothetical protein